MFIIIQGKERLQSNELLCIERFSRIILDLGCGDGKQTYRNAKLNPDHFYFGVDSNSSSLESISYKASRKPSKGGLENIQYVIASAENLPQDFHTVFDEVQIHFPWGSLLQGVMGMEAGILMQIFKVLKIEGILKVYVTYDDKFEENFRERKQLPPLTQEYVSHEMKNVYKSCNLGLINIHLLTKDEKKELHSPWGKKILSSRDRDVYYFEAVKI